MSANGWPDKPGVPVNPDRDGWHWIVWDECADDMAFPYQWVPPDQSWAAYHDGKTPTFKPPFYRYLGPCHTAAEVAALVEQARREERAAIAAWHKAKAVEIRKIAGKNPVGSFDRAGLLCHAIKTRKKRQSHPRTKHAIRRSRQLKSLLPPLRGYCAIGLVQPKTNINVGSVLRAAFCFDAVFVAVSGRRYSRAPTDTMRFPNSAPLFHTDDILSLCPYDCEPVAVDLVPGAEMLTNFVHRPRAFYIFGPEDGTLGASIVSRCARSIAIPTRMCLNLAAAVNVILYDRVAKAIQQKEQADA